MRDLIIAVTGGIGSGKSTVIRELKNLGFPVVSADETYSELLGDKEFVKGIHLSVGLNSSSPVLEREKVSAIVFESPEKLKALDDFTHKKIVEKMFEKTKGKGVCFHEVPLLFEGGFEKLYEKVIVVYRPIEDRINSVIKRSGLTRQEIEKRIKNQYDYENLDNTSHTVIINDGNEEILSRKVKAVVDEIIG